MGAENETAGVGTPAARGTARIYDGRGLVARPGSAPDPADAFAAWEEEP